MNYLFKKITFSFEKDFYWTITKNDYSENNHLILKMYSVYKSIDLKNKLNRLMIQFKNKEAQILEVNKTFT